MKRGLICMMALMLCGCAVQKTGLNEPNGRTVQMKRALDSLIYQEAQSYQNDLMADAYAVQIEQTSGPVMTLLCENGQFDKIIVHAEGHTKWIQVFEDRIICITGDDGNIHAELLHDLSSLGNFEAIVACAEDPVSLVSGRQFQKVSGQQQGSLQIATDNIDFWMKVSSEKKLEQIRLYFSDLPMMTMSYSNDLPLFPKIRIEDYPAYFDVFSLNEDELKEKGFEKNGDVFVRVHEDHEEEISFQDFRMDYIWEQEDMTVRLVYDHLTLTGIYTANQTQEYCEVVLSGEREVSDEIRCDAAKEKECRELFEQLKRNLN